MPTDVADHWSEVWSDRDPEDVSWFQATPQTSLELIQRYAPDRSSAILDVGGGASRLAADLLELGYLDVTVVDMAEAALERARQPMGARAAEVTWTVAEVTQLELQRPVDLWHDRAVLHFLVQPSQQRAYAQRVLANLRPGGHAIIATFGPNGPERCSGLPVQRYDAAAISDTLGLELIEDIQETHVTPDGVEQPFVYAVLRRPASRLA